MDKRTNFIKKYLDQVKEICDLVDLNLVIDFANVIDSYKHNGGRIFIAGVGGSAANASHFVNDLRKITGVEAYSVSENVAELTARVNDESWEDSYVNYLKGSRVDDYDCLIVLSVGGGSKHTSANLVKAMEYFSLQKGKVLSIVSKDGGRAKELSDVCLHVPVLEEGLATAHAEEWQIILLHLIVNLIDNEY